LAEVQSALRRKTAEATVEPVKASTMRGDKGLVGGGESGV
jgi:hypothetical protein